MSLVLRHKPEVIGLVLDNEGWVSIDELVEKSEGKLTFKIIEEAVSQNDKQRFKISENGLRIRANQGHSLKVDLGLKAVEPPILLYHGTATRFISSIKEKGLIAGNRQHVHLSIDAATAQSVGERHGKPIILEVNSKRMLEDAYKFFLSENGVWLTQKVPVQYLTFSKNN